MGDKLEYDYVIIGSGAAGGTIFDKLSNLNKNVLLIDQGSCLNNYDRNNFFFHSLKKFWKYSGYQYARGNISLPILQGISVGGSTTINGSIMQDLDQNFCLQLNKEIDVKNKRYEYENLLNYQKEIKNELKISDDTQKNLNSGTLQEFVKSYGWNSRIQNIAEPDEKDHMRSLSGNSIETHLLRKFKKHNILSSTEVKKIILEKKNITGINCYDKINKKKFFIKVKKKLILSCGVIATANLLKNSNIKNGNIGKKFSCHLSGAIDAFIPKNKNITSKNSQALEIITNDKIFKNFASQKIPNEILLTRLPEDNLEFYHNNLDMISSWVFNISTSSSGYLKKSFGGYNLHYDISKKELKDVKSFIILISKFLFDMGAEIIFPNIISDKNDGLRNLNDLKQLLDRSVPQDFLLTSSHLYGTTCFGKNHNSGVIDENFRVFGYDNLHIVDSGIFPFPTKSNPQLTIMIYAKLASDLISRE